MGGIKFGSIEVAEVRFPLHFSHHEFRAGSGGDGQFRGGLGVALTVSGIGTSFCFPTVANAIMGSVPLEQAGVASGTNSALRELGGVFGIAVLASVFASDGGYHGAHAFMHGFTPAIWVAFAFSGAGVLAAVLTARRTSSPREALEPRALAAQAS